MSVEQDSTSAARMRFASEIAAAQTQEAAFAALHGLSDALVPVRLWTVMTVDLEAGVARRAYSNRPDAYPTSGTKPIVRNAWFDTVVGEHRTFVANTLAEIAEVFPDHELIGELGCGSVMNLSVVEGGEVLATVNLLDEAGHFTPAKVRECQRLLSTPARTAMLKARELAD